jgi:FKBP-type peptidyl-prolyl cis-trans isomerase FklB
MIRSTLSTLSTICCLGVTACLTTSTALGQLPPTNQSGAVEIKPNATVTAEPDAASLLQKGSYIIGFNMTKSLMSDLKQQGVNVDTAKLTEGMQAALSGNEIGMSDEEIRTVMMAFQQLVQKEQIAKMKAAAGTNRTEGDAFLAAHAAKESVQKLKNGVQYTVVTAGDGDLPSVEDTVRIHYHGTLPNGDVFDSSLTKPDGSAGEPVEFPVGRVVPGFSAALQAMKVGSKWQVVIPSDLAYGIQGPGDIGPNRVLVFDIELIEIVK